MSSQEEKLLLNSLEIDRGKYRQIERIATASKTIAVGTHARADTDALASSIIGGHILKAINPELLIHIFTDSSQSHLERYKALIESCPFSVNPDALENYDALYTFDCADKTMLGKYKDLTSRVKAVVNTDHHRNTMFGNLNFVREGASSTSEIMYDYIKDNGIYMPKWVASLLYAGVLTDTGGFINNCDSKTFAMISDLFDKADSRKVVKIFNDNTKESLNLLRAMDIQYLFDNRVFLGIVTQDNLKKAGATLNNTLALSDMGAAIQDVEMSAVGVEVKPQRWRWSLRANDGFDVSKIALQNGGGFSSKKVGAFPTKEKPENVIGSIYSEIEAQIMQHPKAETENPFVVKEPIKLKRAFVGSGYTTSGETGLSSESR